MYLSPCRNACDKRRGCEQYEAMLAHFRGTDITSAKFKCTSFLESYSPGNRVKALITVRFAQSIAMREHYEEGELGIEDINGTVTAVKYNGKIVVMLDEKPFGDSKNRFLRLWPIHITKIDEPDAKACRYCGLPEGEKNSTDHTCIEGCEYAERTGDELIPF